MTSTPPTPLRSRAQQHARGLIDPPYTVIAIDRPGEVWRPIKSFPGYEVSTLGRVRSWRVGGRSKRRFSRPCLLKPTINYLRDSYAQVVLVCGGRPHVRTVHRLVLETFVGRRPAGKETRHKNGDSLDNRLRNLAWGTKSENDVDKIRHGTSQHGERNHQAKLSNRQAAAIRRSTKPLRTVAARYGVSEGTVCNIRLGRSRRRT